MKSTAVFLLIAALSNVPGQKQDFEPFDGTVAGQVMRQPEEESKWREKLQEMDLGPEEKNEARRALDASRSQSGKIKEYKKNIWTKLKSANPDIERFASMADTGNGAESKAFSESYKGYNFFLFLSDSVPRHTRKNYLEALRDVPVVFVLRGLIGEDVIFQPTQDWIAEFLCTDDVCKLGPVDINPNLYRVFQIKEVPALVYIADDSALEACAGEPLPEDSYMVFYGDAPPAVVFEKMLLEQPTDNRLKEWKKKTGGNS